jgi:hypothetical protein
MAMASGIAGQDRLEFDRWGYRSPSEKSPQTADNEEGVGILCSRVNTYLLQ